MIEVDLEYLHVALDTRLVRISLPSFVGRMILISLLGLIRCVSKCVLDEWMTNRVICGDMISGFVQCFLLLITVIVVAIKQLLWR